MTRPIIIGVPGERLAQLRRAELLSVLLHGGATIVLVVVSTVVFTRSPGPLGYLSALAGVGGAAIETRRAARAQSKLARLEAGWRAERAVGKVLRRARVDVVAHGVVVGRTGDSDHVVLGPCAAVIETKHGRGPVEVRDGALIMRGRRMPRDPLAQAARQSDLIGRHLQVATTPVVCIVDMTNRPFVTDGVIVCSARDLNGVLDGLPAVVTTGASTRLAERLR